jgi:4-hydroxybenzoyl-CoA reductase subunit alpha
MSDESRPAWAVYPTHAGEPASGGVVGVAGPKIDGRSKLTGKARFVADLKLPRMAHAKLLRSPHPHARIVSIDLSEALALPGVLGAMTGEDVPRRYGAIPVAQDETALATGKVRYVGEPVACVAALDEETAMRALSAIKVVYDPIEPVLTLDDALDESKPLVHDEARKPSNVLRRVHQSFGDPDAGFAQADVIVEKTLEYPGSTHVPLEPHAALADWDGSKLTLWSSTQNPHYVLKDVARVLGVREQDVRLVKPAVGAGYGGKCDPFATDICSAFLARKLGRPVKITLEREEVFYAHRGRHPTRMKIKMGVARDGRITAVDLEAWARGGAYASYGVVTAYYLGVFGTLPYVVDHYRFTSGRVYTNEPPCGPKRGHGAIQPRFAFEVALDEAADRLGLDPAELRRKNVVPQGHETVNGLVVGSVGLQECLDAVVAASGWNERRGKLGRGKGLGIAASAYMCGALHPVHPNDMSQSTVQLKVDRSGEVTLFSGTADVGQGSANMLAVLCAERLGLAPSDVRVIEGDSALTPVDLGSYSSRVTFMAGNACVAAANQVRARILSAVAAKIGVYEADLALRDGRVFVEANPEKGVTWVQAIQLAEEKDGPIGAVGGYKPPKIGNRFRRQSVGPSPAYSFTAAVAEVEVDEETGVVRVTRVWCAHDCGRALNPTIVEGQIEGCVYMGVGEALYEEQAYRDGMVKAPSILEYRIPTVHETPEILVTIVESHEPGGPFGAKEAGEGPQLPIVPAIANAIRDAVGVTLTKPPFTPDRVLKAIAGATPAATGRR